MIGQVIAAYVFWIVVMVALCIGGPMALVAWIVAIAPWLIADKRGLLPRTSIIEVILVLVILQIPLDAIWPHSGDALFVWFMWTGLSAAVRFNDFPRAQVRRYR